MRIINLILIILCCSILVNSTEPKMLLNNPGSGLISYDVALNMQLLGTQNVEEVNLFQNVYLAEVVKDNCINADGTVNKTNLYESIKSFFDSRIDYTKNSRLILRIFPTYNGSGPYDGCIKLKHVKTDDGQVYVWLPEKLYRIMEKSEYPPIIEKMILKDRFKDTQNVAVPDFRNEYLRCVYESAIEMFAKYLQETVEMPQLKSSTNVYGRCKKGDFIFRIQIGFIGPWGEGITSSYENYDNIDCMVDVVEMYKKHLGDYWLLAPSYGMRKNTTTNKVLYGFQQYLLTTTYGVDSRLFGFFIDHLGFGDRYDFELMYNNLKYRTIAKNRYKKAPVMGENNGMINENAQLIKADFEEYGISLCKPWSNQKEYSPAVLNAWREAIDVLEFKLYYDSNVIISRDNGISIKFNIGNKGAVPCYDDFWKLQLVLRKNYNEGAIKVIDVPIYNIRNIIDNCFFVVDEKLFSDEELESLTVSDVKVYIRIVDKCHINENMYLNNSGRTEYGEYLLYNLKLK